MNQKKTLSSLEFRCIWHIDAKVSSACCLSLPFVQKVKEFKQLKGLFLLESQGKMQTNKREIQVREGCSEQRFVMLSDRGRTNPGGFKLTTWQPRLWKNAALPTLGRTFRVANTGIQEQLELLKVSMVYRLLQLLSCNLSKSRNRPL